FSVVVSEISRRASFAVFTNGRVTWNFGYLTEDDRQIAFREALAERLVAEFGADFPPDLERRYPPLVVEKWADRVGELEDLLVGVIEQSRKRASRSGSALITRD
ncbi:MAG: hypothetical protein ACE5IL_18170, partial [Myxococcota bacterium]